MSELDTLARAISRSTPPQRMPGYWLQWRAWWRVALGLLRRERATRAERSAWHAKLSRAYQAAAWREGGERGHD